MNADTSSKSRNAIVEETGRCPIDRLGRDDWLRAYRFMATARQIEQIEQEWIRRGWSAFSVSGAGHESSVFAGMFMGPDDWLHPHYRDKALMLARGLTSLDFFRSTLARDGSSSRGRQMGAHMSSRRHRVASTVGPIGNHALHAVGMAAAVAGREPSEIVVCSIGDGGTQQGEFLEAIAEAVRWSLPVLFLILDNRYSISTCTKGKTFFSLPDRENDQFYGIPIERVDGSDPERSARALGRAIGEVRGRIGPRIVAMQVARLCDHTNSDQQAIYRDASEVAEEARRYDPLRNLQSFLIERGHAHPLDIESTDREILEEVQASAEQALRESDPPIEAACKRPYPTAWDNRRPYRGGTQGSCTMRDAICQVLGERLAADPRVILYGQDIEDPKGDVFGVTRGLSTRFPGRVLNSPLSESTIVGVGIGRGLAGQKPVAFIQFADFIPLAMNQLASELGTMYWRTDGTWQCPLIVMASCGGYKPGLGPFHAQTMEALLCHLPGIDVFCPSNAGDAAALLQAAFESDRPTVFLYPKALLNRSDRGTSNDIRDHWVLPGTARFVSNGSDLTLVTWGNTVPLGEAVSEILKEHGVSLDCIDLRSLSPWDRHAVIDSVERTGKLVVTHEDSHTCGFGAEIIATVAASVKRRIKVLRVTRDDVHVPFHFANQTATLPSLRSILNGIADLLGIPLSWIDDTSPSDGRIYIRAVGSGPSDDRVRILSLNVRMGESLTEGTLIGEMEASKATVEISASASGEVLEVCAKPGDWVAVGSPLIALRRDDTTADYSMRHAKESKSPRIARLETGALRREPDPTGTVLGRSAALEISILKPESVLGSRVVDSDTIAKRIDGWNGEIAYDRTGVRCRHWVGPNESTFSLALAATEKLLRQYADPIPPISLVICSTTTPCEATPSVACQVVSALRDRLPLSPNHHAFDINAACSGFVYALRCAGDHLAREPESSVLVITSEVISVSLNLRDPNTCFLFGDGATATFAFAEPSANGMATIQGIRCQNSVDPARTIWSPCMGASGNLEMNGIAVARNAYKGLADALLASCGFASVALDQLTAVVPHPGSKRILMSAAERLGMPPSKLLHTLEETGNTSSSSIPLALDRLWDRLPHGVPVGLCAFGAGYTTGGAVLTKKEKRRVEDDESRKGE